MFAVIGLLGFAPLATSAQVVVPLKVREIPIYGPEWQSLPWCVVNEAGPVYPKVTAREPLPLKKLGMFPIYYHYLESTLVNRGRYECVVDLEYRYWGRGVSSDAAPTASVMRSYAVPVGGSGVVSSGLVGSCIRGNGGTFAISVKPTPSIWMQEPNGSCSVVVFYDCD